MKHERVIAFDLDETLIHCFDEFENYGQPDIFIEVPIVGRYSSAKTKVGLNIRPYAVECLQRLSANFTLVVFTASAQPYADAVLQALDPERTIFS